jgi:2-polyprenyl-3-methyl-5-hydroxy-6-metoxy-1,4-benzoquinol methylase
MHSPTRGDPPHGYDDLIAREAAHWSGGRGPSHEPQIWDDPALFEIFFGREFRLFFGAIRDAGDDVLELGCGDGLLACDLARSGAAVTGVDLSPERIARARAGASSVAPGHVDFIVGDLNTMALPEARFDVVVAHDALHHLLNIEDVLDRAARSLRPPGRLVILDYIGMGRPRRVLAAGLAAILPTHRSYGEKWALRSRLPAFMANEGEKRAALAAGGGRALHPESPFEEISQAGMLAAINARFRILRQITFNPFWFYLAPKVRFPRLFRPGAARLMRRMDELLVATRLCRGAYLFLEARPR